MRIKKIILRGVHRLLNKGTSSIVWTPMSPHQIIMGNNGYGKSTLMEHFSLLPGENKEFTKHGYKEVIAEHNGVEYRVVSDFSKKHIHSFWIGEGKNLNEGGTITIQKHLIEEHLGYTQEIHNLVLGKIKFTELGTEKRKEWFSKISSVNVDYGLKLFGKLKKQARDYTGARKHVESQILVESEKLLTDDEITELRNSIASINDRIGELNRLRDGYVPEGNKDITKYWLEQIDQYVADLKAIDDIPNRIALSYDDFKVTCSTEAEKLNSMRAKLDSLFNEQETANNAFKYLEESNITTKELEEQFQALKVDLSNVKLTGHIPDTNLLNVSGMVSTLESIIDALDDVYKSLDENPKGERYNGELLKLYSTKHSELVEAIARDSKSLDNRINHLANLRSHDPVNCPNCDHTWTPGVSERQVAKLEHEIEVGSKALEEFKVQEQELLETLTKIRDYAELRQLLVKYRAQYPVLKPYWNYIETTEDLNESPMSLIVYTRKYLEELRLIDKRDRLQAKYDELESHVLKRREMDKKASNLMANQTFSKLETDIYNQQQLIAQQTAKVESLKADYRKVTQAVLISEKLNDAIKSYYDEYRKLWDAEREGILKDTVNQLSAEHYSNWTKLNELEAAQKVVKHLETDKESLDRKQQVMDAVLEALSPTSGLIASTLVSFMNEFVGQMNNVISRIWTTKLEIQPCTTKRDEFTYKFPVRVESGSEHMSDVSMGSTGELDIFNFTFRLIAMQYMGLSNYPIFADELGSSFRIHHKRRLYDYLKLLTDSGDASQLIVISHFTDTVDELNRADVNVIDRTGLLVPENGNKYFEVT